MSPFAQWHLQASRSQYRASMAGLAVSVTCICGLSNVAIAATVGPGNSVEEVIVTARKTSERLQDVPVSITAITSEQLKELGAVDVKDILGNVPGLAFIGVERGLSKYNIRGISNNVESPTVGVYLDDLSLVTIDTGFFTGSADPIFFDVERLEVLKGPQGTLYGGSTMGGAIKYVSARPDLAVLSSNVALGFGTTAHGSESYNAESVVNVPIIDNVLAVRGGVFYRRDGGYIDNVSDGDIVYPNRSSTPAPVYTPLARPALSTLNEADHNYGDTYVGRLSLLWQPDSSWAVRPAVFYQDYKLANNSQYFPNQGELTESARVKQPTHDRTGIYSLDVNKEWGAVRLTSVTGYFDRKLEWVRDYSYFFGNQTVAGVPFALFALNSEMDARSATETFSQELRISSAGGKGSRVGWLAGLYYSDQDDEFKPYATTFGATPILGTEASYFSEAATTVKQSAAFGEVTFALTDSFDITAGARLFKVEQDYKQFADGPFNGGRTDLVGNSDEDGVNPKFGLSYKLTQDNLLYTSAAKGFRPGGPNRQAIPATLCAADLLRLGYSTAPTEYESDNLWTYELGSKNQFGGTTINGALFYTDWKDIQQAVGLPSCGFSFTTNAGAARVRGAELETRFNVTSAFAIGGTGTYTDTEIVETVVGVPAQKGDEIRSVPKLMASGFASLSVPFLGEWDLEMRANYQYRSKARTSFDRTRRVTFSNGARVFLPNEFEFQEEYDVVNASASVTNGPMTVRLYINNVLDEQPALYSGVGFATALAATTLRPRTFGLELRHQF